MKENVPIPLKPWVNLYRKVPNLFNLFGVNITFSLLCSCFFGTCRMLFAKLFYATGFEKDKLARDAIASTVPILHSTILEFPLLMCLLTQPYKPSARMDKSSTPKWYKDSVHALLEYTSGYMIYDTFNSILYESYVRSGISLDFNSNERSWLIHHLVTFTYMLFCRIYNRGHISAMSLMFAGEYSNPLHNFLYIINYSKKIGLHCGPNIGILEEYTEFFFGLVYGFLRIIAGPLISVHVTYDMLFTSDGRKNVPMWLSMFWVVGCWIIVLGSLPWAFEALKPVLSFLNKRGLII